MKDYEIDTIGVHPPHEHDEYAVIRNLAKEVGEALIKKVKLERVLTDDGQPHWVAWTPRAKFTCKALLRK